MAQDDERARCAPEVVGEAAEVAALVAKHTQSDEQGRRVKVPFASYDHNTHNHGDVEHSHPRGDMVHDHGVVQLTKQVGGDGEYGMTGYENRGDAAYALAVHLHVTSPGRWDLIAVNQQDDKTWTWYVRESSKPEQVVEGPAGLGKSGLADSQHGALQALTRHLSDFPADIEWEMTVDKRAHGWRWRAVRADRLAPDPAVVQDRGGLNKSNRVQVRVPAHVMVHEALTPKENDWLAVAVRPTARLTSSHVTSDFSGRLLALGTTH